jgi:hypothetical protein
MSAGKSKASITPATEKPAPLPTAKLELTDAEQAEVCVHAKRVKARRQAPRFAVRQQEGNQLQMMPTGVHAEVAGAGLMNAFGITDLDLAESLFQQIVNATHVQPLGVPVAEGTLNAALAAVTGIGPRDEAEAMLAAQMVGVHWIAMALLSKAGSTNDRALLNDAGNMAVKLLRTFAAHLETLKRYRSAGEQRVVVQHQHVNVTADQAAVQVNGVAPDPGGRGAVSKLEDQPHASGIHQSVPHEPSTPLQRPDPARDTVPASGCGRAEAVSDARRR